ncbi:hypothetical protein QE440_004395 [Pseudomonas psychrotolerans]|uniref:Uncharacterized protein n=1 Tax=Pseudomonas oryzihabitans TaxID=47885 RepID=A0AAJ2EYN5_9PSED|nr:hypothetical protein [Pseudomonas psychrotolerans]
MGQLVHQHQFRRLGQQALQIQLGELEATVLDPPQRLLRQTGEQGGGLPPSMGFDDPGTHPATLAQGGLGGLQHGVGLAHPGGGTEKDLEAPAPFAMFGEQRFGAPGAVGHLLRSARARLRSRTLTVAGPKSEVCVCSRTMASSRSGARPRAAAMRAI